MIAGYGVLIALIGIVLSLLNYGHAWLGRVGLDGRDSEWRRGYRAGTKQIASVLKGVILLGIGLVILGVVLQSSR